MKIAVLADLHLTEGDRTVKHAVLDWVVSELQERRPDIVALIGDMTAFGTPHQNRMLIRSLLLLGIPYCSTPGNAELRSTPENGRLWDIRPAPGIPLVLADSSTYELPESDLEKLRSLPDGAGYLLATHVPPYEWNEAARAVLDETRSRGAVTAVIAGHQHNDGEERLRGLDPDKAAGGAPRFDLFDNAGGSWSRTPVEMSEADVRTWPESERLALFSHFGVSAMWETLETLEAACALGIPHVEFRYSALERVSDSELKAAIDRWRGVCGKTLSMHLPNLRPEDGGVLAEAVGRTLELGCDRVTLHVPAVTAAEFPAQRERLIANFLRDMKPLLDAGIDIGIENLHTTPGKESDDARNFGCTIGECRSWIEALRQAAGGNERIGFHLDIGHARNNKPFNSFENLSDYYAELGGITNGCHFHQVSPQPSSGDSGNHTPFTGLYDKLISLAGFFLAWRCGQFPHKPALFLEIRGAGAGVASYRTMKELITGAKQ